MKNIDVIPKTTFSGRQFTRKQLKQVQETVTTFNNLSRKELALTVCEHLNWKTPRGSLKVNSALKLFEELEKLGVITLPEKRKAKAPVKQLPTFNEPPDATPIEGTLDSLAPVTLQLVESKEDWKNWKAYIHTYHYLGYKHPFGSYLCYFVVSQRTGRKLGCLLFTASAAWALGPRDKWIGWEDKQRKRMLSHILSNDRFLIFPWVNVKNLASKVLSLAVKQIGDDWVHAHSYRPVLIETFVDKTRYSGACYQAANWSYLGETQGRGCRDTKNERKQTIKDIYVYPLRPDWQESLTEGTNKAELRKRYRNDVQKSHTRSVGDSFIQLWEQVAHLFNEVAKTYDEKWRVRKRVINSLLLMLLIFRLVTSKNSQGYGTTIDDLWDSCERMKLSLPQNHAIAPSSFCAARQKLNESIFQTLNRRILDEYASKDPSYDWRGHRVFAVDGSKINLPRNLTKYGYLPPTKSSYYPQGLISCLYQLKSHIPFDFDLVSNPDEAACARKHLDLLHKDDLVVYDRGYFSYAMLYKHVETGVHALFRLRKNACMMVKEFFNSNQTDMVTSYYPLKTYQKMLKKKHPHMNIMPLKMRLMKYKIKGTTYCIGTTLVQEDQIYPLTEFKDLYHARWGIEELYKVSKNVIEVNDFHAKSERGVKQEIFAHFTLITMSRLFANQAEKELNSEGDGKGLHHAHSSPGNSGRKGTGMVEKVKVNFKNCIHVLSRCFEELLLLGSQMSVAIERTYHMMIGRKQKVREGRSYERTSRKPESKWQTSNTRQRKKAAAAARLKMYVVSKRMA